MFRVVLPLMLIAAVGLLRRLPHGCGGTPAREGGAPDTHTKMLACVPRSAVARRVIPAGGVEPLSASYRTPRASSPGQHAGGFILNSMITAKRAATALIGAWPAHPDLGELRVVPDAGVRRRGSARRRVALFILPAIALGGTMIAPLPIFAVVRGSRSENSTPFYPEHDAPRAVPADQPTRAYKAKQATIHSCSRWRYVCKPRSCLGMMLALGIRGYAS